MLAVFRKILATSLVVLIALSTGAWQSHQPASGKSKDTVKPPLYPDINWSDQGASTQNIRINVNGDTVSLSGNSYAAQEQYPFQLPDDVLSYYSNEQLANSGWESYDWFEGPDGVHQVFYHESGVYLAVELLKCQEVPTSICLVIWQSEPVETEPAATTAPAASTLEAAAASTFGKRAPADGATNVSPTSATFSWQAYSPTPDKYSYCLKVGSDCDRSDPNWTSTYDTSVTLSGLATNTTYHWQVRAVTCVTCTPKVFVYADGGDTWTFRTTTNSRATIVGNVGTGGATLSYTDGTAKTVTADGTGAYTISVPLNWSGTVTPSKSGYIFTPASASFTNLTAVQTIQNFVATPVYTISGNTGVGSVTLSYTNGTPQTVTSNGSGNYSISVPAGWSGTVTPSKPGYIFSPTSRSYTNVTANQTSQNYAATFVTYTISGNAGRAGVTLTFPNGFATSDGSGNYSITVPMGWSGTVTPHETGYSFTPASRTYNNVQANQAGQNYTPAVCPSCADKDTVGVYRPTNGLLYLKNENISGYADVSINYGLAGDYPVTGDWNGDGTATIGVYRNGSFLLRNSNTVGVADIQFAFGMPGDQPIAGDWDGDGDDTIGVYRSSTFTFYLRNSNSAGPADAVFSLGIPGDVGIAGDWTNKGFDTVGVFRPSNGVIYLKNANTSGFADIAFNYGQAGDKPLAGDWNNDGKDTIGVLRGNNFLLRNSNTAGFADLNFTLGYPGDIPIAGNWDDKP